MDTVREENSCRDCKKVGFRRNDDLSDESSDDEENTRILTKQLVSNEKERYLHPPQIYIHAHPGAHDLSTRNYESDRGDSSNLSSRRPSAIIAALRRPSQAIALSAAHAVIAQRRYIMNLFDHNQDRNYDKNEPKESKESRFNAIIGHDRLTVILSALYAKLLVVMGLALPMTEAITHDVGVFQYHGFYLYLYTGSMAFLVFEYVSCVREKAFREMIKNYEDSEKAEFLSKHTKKHIHKYGSFYLRLGAISFGIGSMVYSGLEFGRYFDMRNNPNCQSSTLIAVSPAIRMVLTLLQIQFIFLNHKDFDINQHKIIARFGLMHMIATNLCEWLYVVIEETKHEIVHLKDHAVEHGLRNSSASNISLSCEGRLMGSLISDASPFLFPCTIEYSLICAVILYEMWKHIKPELCIEEETPKEKKERHRHDLDMPTSSSSFHFTIDCSNSHRGLFAGIVVIVLTIISLIMFFVLADSNKENTTAQFEVNVVELVLYITTTIAVLVAMYQLRSLRYVRKFDEEGVDGIGLDNTLLTVAQTGMFIYCMFSIIGWGFVESNSNVGMVADIFSFIQTCLQTMFVLDGWFRRCRNIEQAKKKPGKELITFLIVANLAMWTINTLEKNRAEFRPTHLKFFGNSAWAIITHISMPLAIFYRFHSTICLFEIWKSAYKIKSSFKNPLFPVSNL